VDFPDIEFFPGRSLCRNHQFPLSIEQSNHFLVSDKLVFINDIIA
jgi:hypothetical protein